MLRLAFALFRKDFFLLMVRGSALAQALLLGLLLVFIFSLAQGAGDKVPPETAGAIFWLSSAFCVVLIFNQLFALEEINGSRFGLLMSPAPIQGVWLGKAMCGLLLLLILQLVFLPAVMVFLNQSFQGMIFQALFGTMLVDIGMCTLGALLGALAQGHGSHESMLSIIIFPLLMPLLLAGISIYSQILGAVPNTGSSAWIGMAAAFDAVFIGVSLVLFCFIYARED